jgi:hypothetical protein
MTLADLLTVWADKALPNRALADSAITSHRWAIKILVEEIGNVKVRRLTPDQVEAAFLRRRSQMISRRAARYRTDRPHGAPEALGPGYRWNTDAARSKIECAMGLHRGRATVGTHLVCVSRAGTPACGA